MDKGGIGWPAGPDGLAQLGLWSIGPEPSGGVCFLSFFALFSVFFSLYIFFSILFF